MSSIKSNFIAKDFARRVKQRRKTLMLPMTQLAKKLGVSEPEYTQIESGTVPFAQTTNANLDRAAHLRKMAYRGWLLNTLDFILPARARFLILVRG